MYSVFKIFHAYLTNACKVFVKVFSCAILNTFHETFVTIVSYP